AVPLGACVRIMTGGPLPPWADTVIPVEQSTMLENGDVRFSMLPERGANIRREGEDLVAGALILTHGTRLDPERIMVAAAFGHRELNVYERPRLVFISTGDELIEPGDALPPGGVYNSSKYYLQAAAAQLGFVDAPHLTIPDDSERAAKIVQEHVLT